jgi:hypothetical protein
VAAEVAAVGRVQAVGLDDHGHRVPAHVGAQALFHLEVAGERSSWSVAMVFT